LKQIVVLPNRQHNVTSFPRVQQRSRPRVREIVDLRSLAERRTPRRPALNNDVEINNNHIFYFILLG